MTNSKPKFPKPPKPAQIVAAREALGLTQAQAAAVIYHRERGWRYIEAGERRMHPALWELWCLKTDAVEAVKP